MLKEFIVSTTNDKYDLKEKIMADSFGQAARVFAEYYHGNKRNLFQNDVTIEVEDKLENKQLAFTIKAKNKVYYEAERI